MPVFLKDVKKDLQTGAGEKKKNTPPNYIRRKLGDYTKLGLLKPDTKFTALGRVDDKRKSKGTVNGSIEFKAVVNSEEPNRPKGKDKLSPSRPNYLVTIMIHDVSFNNKESRGFENEIEVEARGSIATKFFKIPIYAKNPVTMRCQCADFRFRFETELSDAGGLFGGEFGGLSGSARPYTRKTPVWTEAGHKAWVEDPANNQKPYPYANASKKLGVCKHIYSLITYIEDRGFIRNAPL